MFRPNPQSILRVIMILSSGEASDSELSPSSDMSGWDSSYFFCSLAELNRSVSYESSGSPLRMRLVAFSSNSKAMSISLGSDSNGRGNLSFYNRFIKPRISSASEVRGVALANSLASARPLHQKSSVSSSAGAQLSGVVAHKYAMNCFIQQLDLCHLGR